MLLLKHCHSILFTFHYLLSLKLAFTFILLNIFLFSGVTVLYATETIVLNVTGKPPLSDSMQNGFMDRIVYEAFKRLNLKLETVQLPAERALINTNNGIIDGEMSRVAGLSKKYNNLIQVDEKVMDWEFVVYSNKNITLNSGWHSLIPYSVSIINGWKILEKNVPPGVELTKVKNTEQLFGMLKLKRSDLIIYEKWGGKYYLKTHNITGVKLIAPPLIVKGMFIYLHKKHRKLAIKLAKTLKNMKSDGTYQKIMSKTLLN